MKNYPRLTGILAAICCTALVAFAALPSPGVQATLTATQLQQQLSTVKSVTLEAKDYKIDRAITVPDGGRLVGVPGTRLVISHNGTKADSTITMGRGAILSNVEIWRDDVSQSQKLSQADYPWAITIPQGVAGARVENVRLGNAPRGIQARGLNYVLEDIWGNPVLCGLNIDTGGNTATIRGLRFNEPAYTVQEGPLWQQWLDEGIGVDLERIDGLMGSDWCIYSANVGILIRGSDYEGDGGFWKGTAAGGVIHGGSCDNCNTGIKITAVGPRTDKQSATGWTGITLSGFHFIGRNNLTQLVDVASDTPSQRMAYPVTMLGCFFGDFLANPSPKPAISISNGHVELVGCNFVSRGNQQFYLWAERGQVTLTGGSVEGRKGMAAVLVGPNVDSAIINGVRGLRGRVVNNAKQAVEQGCTEPFQGQPKPAPDEPDNPPPPPVDPPVSSAVEVGPGKQYAELHLVPWDKLTAGTVVKVHWRQEPYRSKFQIPVGGITVEGVKSATGDLPIVSGENAVEWSGCKWWNQDEGKALIGIQPFIGGPKVKNVTIKSLNICHAHRDKRFQQLGAGPFIAWAPGCAGIFMKYCEGITIEDCAIHHNENGCFSKCYGNEHGTVRGVTMRGCYVYANGVADSDRQHNSYIEAIGTLYERNTFLSPLPEAKGANVKDRGCGTVIRNNYIEGGERLIDLVEPVEGSAIFTADPLWAEGHRVEGNVIIDPQVNGSVTPLHVGSDGDGPIAPKKCTVTFNTFVSANTQAKPDWRRIIFKCNSEQTLTVANNIFDSYSPENGNPGEFYLITDDGPAGSKVNLGANYFPSFAAPSMNATLTANVTGWAEQIKGTSPGFVDRKSNWSLAADSVCRGKATGTGPSFGWSMAGWRPRSAWANLGATE